MVLGAVQEVMLQLEHTKRLTTTGNNAAIPVSVSRQFKLCKAQS